jgi:hypothetical protein
LVSPLTSWCYASHLTVHSSSLCRSSSLVPSSELTWGLLCTSSNLSSWRLILSPSHILLVVTCASVAILGPCLSSLAIALFNPFMACQHMTPTSSMKFALHCLLAVRLYCRLHCLLAASILYLVSLCEHTQIVVVLSYRTLCQLLWHTHSFHACSSPF